MLVERGAACKQGPSLALLPRLVRLASASARLRLQLQPCLVDGLLAIFLHQASLAAQVAIHAPFWGHS